MTSRWLLLGALGLAACGSDAAPDPVDAAIPPSTPRMDGGATDAGEVGPSDAGAPDASAPSGPPVVEVVASGLIRPWAIAFLPDGRALVTTRVGDLYVLARDGQVSEPLQGVPEVHARGQGGLLDVVAGPSFDEDRLVYFCYAAADASGASGTELARARFTEGGLEDVQRLFAVEPKVRGGSNHYGCRIAFSGSGHLFLGVGDRFGFLDEAQNLGNHLGKVLRLNPDGSVPTDNPFVGRSDARDEIWSYGHRNIQGMATHPATGEVWTHEHGPRGGDEVNRPAPGANHGWPVVSYGDHYDGRPIPDDHAGRGFAEPVHFWTPSIAPSGMVFYDGELFPEWQGDLLVGALAFTHLARLEIDGASVLSESRLLDDRGQRIRDVTVGPEGAIYVVTDAVDGQILRITRSP